MPIYEYYCPDNNKIYQFYAKTLAQGRTTPTCPENSAYRMMKLVSKFAVSKKGKSGGESDVAPSPEGASAGMPPGGGAAEDPRMDAAMESMEREFSQVDENDPRAMGRMMRRMAELSGEKIDGEMEEVVRKLEEGTDPESLEDQLGGREPGADDPYGEGPGGPPSAGADPKEPGRRLRVRRGAPVRDPALYDYD